MMKMKKDNRNSLLTSKYLELPSDTTQEYFKILISILHESNIHSRVDAPRIHRTLGTPDKNLGVFLNFLLRILQDRAKKFKKSRVIQKYPALWNYDLKITNFRPKSDHERSCRNRIVSLIRDCATIRTTFSRISCNGRTTKLLMARYIVQ